MDGVVDEDWHLDQQEEVTDSQVHDQDIGRGPERSTPETENRHLHNQCQENKTYRERRGESRGSNRMEERMNHSRTSGRWKKKRRERRYT